MLTDPNLVKLVMRMLTVSVVFCQYVCRCVDKAQTDIDNAQFVFERADFNGKQLFRLIVFYESTHLILGAMQKFSKQFDGLQKLLLEALTAFSATQTHLINLLTRLDFNNFYANLSRPKVSIEINDDDSNDNDNDNNDDDNDDDNVNDDDSDDGGLMDEESL
jgi:hypothetical protein